VIPTADQIAIAIVAAARETAEPGHLLEIAEACVRGTKGLRARFYAFGALRHVFPEVARTTLAKLVGCPGMPLTFVANFQHSVIKPVMSAKGQLRPHVAKWWDEAAYGRVIAALEATLDAGPKPADVDLSDLSTGVQQRPTAPARLTRAPAPSLRPVSPSAALLDSGAGRQRIAPFYEPEDQPRLVNPNRGRARSMLEDAMAETAKQQARLEREGKLK